MNTRTKLDWVFDRETIVQQYVDGELKDLAKDSHELYDLDSSPLIAMYTARPDVGGECVVHFHATQWTGEKFIVCDLTDLSKALEPLKFCCNVLAEMRSAK